MPDVVLDASAVLAYLRGEPGADRVLSVMPGAAISAVNLSEVIQKLLDLGAPEEVVIESIGQLPCRIVAFDGEQAVEAGLLRVRTRAKGLSLGDRACLALAAREQVAAFTADRVWGSLDLDLEVVLIR